MKRAHSSGKLKGTKKPMTRKRFVARLDYYEAKLVRDFYEMIEPLDKEVAMLRARVSSLAKDGMAATVKVADSLGAKLDQMIAQNEMLYDRLMLALDGERPPKGILFTVEALAPFAAVVELIDSDVRDDFQIAHWATLTERRNITVGHLREAAKSYEHFIGKKR